MHSAIPIQDPELGTIYIRCHPRAVRFTFRVRDDALVATVPYTATKTELLQTIRSLYPQLMALLHKKQDRQKAQRITPDFRIDVEGFSYWAEEDPQTQCLSLQRERGRLVLHYPPGTDFNESGLPVGLSKHSTSSRATASETNLRDENFQKRIVFCIEESLRAHARYYFLPRLREMAETRGLRFTELAIHKSRGRWGSCSTKGKISLSLFVMLLPRHLQDYIMQHELTHLIHMNHSSRFWADLDKAMGADSKALRRELKQYDTSIFQYEENMGK